jgi:hypothetical protein
MGELLTYLRAVEDVRDFADDPQVTPRLTDSLKTVLRRYDEMDRLLRVIAEIADTAEHEDQTSRFNAIGNVANLLYQAGWIE